MSSRRFNRSIKGLLRFISFLWLSLVGVLASRGTTTKATTNPLDKHNVNHEVLTVGRKKHLARSKVNINYMSKRKVPYGPDPMHNRRAGNSRRPPGQA